MTHGMYCKTRSCVPTRSSISFKEIALSTRGSIGSASILRSADIAAGARATGLRRTNDHGATRNEEPADDSVDSDPTYPLERAEREQIVDAALRQLGPEHRAVVVLKDFDGRRYEEIGAILNVPVGTVRSRLHRARCELRDRLRCLIDVEQPAREASK